MAEIPLSKDELKALLAEQLAFLKASSASFDSGFEGEIKRLAVTTRVLLHDTPKSVSLLTQLGGKTRTFFDTATPYDERNQLSHASLVSRNSD